MLKKKLKTFWFNLIPSQYCFINNENFGNFFLKQKTKNIYDFNKIWFYISYCLKIYTQINYIQTKPLIITEDTIFANLIKSLAFKLNCFYLHGGWKGGLIYRFILKCNIKINIIINFSLNNTTNFFNEINLLSIINISLIQNLKINQKALTYFLPIFFNNFNFIKKLYYIFICFYTKQIKIQKITKIKFFEQNKIFKQNYVVKKLQVNTIKKFSNLNQIKIKNYTIKKSYNYFIFKTIKINLNETKKLS